MKLTLRVVPLFSPGPKADVKGGLPALAWTDRKGNIFVRGPFHRVFLARARLAHEVEHNIADFCNKDHHPAACLCGRVGHGLRLFGSKHLSPRSWKLAACLKRDGDSVEV